MIAELVLLLAGHKSSLFLDDASLNPAFASLLHPGEQHALLSIAQVAFRYTHITAACTRLSQSSSRYICALCACLRLILADEYRAHVIQTEAQILSHDPALVAAAAFVPLSSIRALFSQWDAPFAALVHLLDLLEAQKHWNPGPLIDLLLSCSHTGVHRIATIFDRLSSAVQRVWRSQIAAFIVHGSISPQDPLASQSYTLLDGSIPSCISPQSRDSIQYVGRAVATVKAAKWQKQLPTAIASHHTHILDSVLPQNQHAFDRVIAQIRFNVSEWLWRNVLTRKDIDDAVNSLYVLPYFSSLSLNALSKGVTISCSETENSVSPLSAKLTDSNFPASPCGPLQCPSSGIRTLTLPFSVHLSAPLPSRILLYLVSASLFLPVHCVPICLHSPHLPHNLFTHTSLELPCSCPTPSLGPSTSSSIRQI